MTTPGLRMPSAALRRSRVAILSYFFVPGVAGATFSARLPAIKLALHLSDGRLGLALFAIPAGSVLTLPVSGRIADKFGAVRVLRIGGVLVPVALVPVGLARDLPWLIVTLVIYGAMFGLLDVSMNACGARLELGYDRPIFSSLHAGYSIAGLAAFSVTMAAGRLAGDRLASRFGSVMLVRASGLVAGLGLAAGLLIGSQIAAVAGFALLGLGLAGIFPQLVTSAARLDPDRAGRNIGRIAAIAYSGLLSGPVAIGVIASGVGLRDALLVPATLAVAVTALAGVMKT